jgi:hypothetical protein
MSAPRPVPFSLSTSGVTTEDVAKILDIHLSLILPLLEAI